MGVPSTTTPLPRTSGDKLGIDFFEIVTRDSEIFHYRSDWRLEFTVVKECLFCSVTAGKYFINLIWVNLPSNIQPLRNLFERPWRKSDIRIALPFWH